MLHHQHIARTVQDAVDPPRAAWRTAEFWEAARAEGMLALAHDRVAREGWPGVEASLRRQLDREVVDEAARSALAAADLRRILHALHDHAVAAVVIKGAALAYTLYRRPELRPSIDTDLLIQPRAAGEAHQVFRSLGAAYVPHVTGQYVMSQFHYVTTDRVGHQHVYDVHWRIVNRLAFAGALSWEEVLADSQPVTAYGVLGRAPSRPHALMLACVHRAAHHPGADRLIWLYDIHLLAGALDDGERQRVVERAAGRVADVIRDGLLAAHDLFGGTASSELAAGLRASSRGGAAGPSARRSGTRLGDAVSDLVALRPWGARVRLLQELVCPPAAYMRVAYAPSSRAPLLWLYVRRLLAALWRWRAR